MLRRGLIGGAGARIAAGMSARRQPETPQITKRELPPNMPPAAIAEAIRRQGGDVGLEWALMQQGQALPVQPAASVAPARPGLFGSARNRAKAAVANVMPQTVQPAKSGSNGFMGAAMDAVPMLGASQMAAPTPQIAPMPAQPQVKAGMQAAAQDVAARPAGAFAQGPKPMTSAQQPVGLWDEIWADPFTFFLTGTDGLDRKYGRAAEAEARRAGILTAEQAKAEQARQVQALRDEGFSEAQIVAFMNNPEKWSESLASNVEAANIGAGDSRLVNGQLVSAPRFGFEGATPYAQTFADGKLTTTFGDRRPQSYAEQTAEGTLAETGRHNRATEANAADRLAFDRTRPAGGAGGELTPYQMYQIGRDQKEDAAAEREAQGAARTSITNIQESQSRIQSLIDHPGFKGIYGAFGGLGVNMGAKPTNIMSQDELNAMALLDQIGGEAFLAGVQKMRGTGPLSDNEGKRVMQAVTRLTNRMQDSASALAAAQEFLSALQALEEAVARESGMESMVPRLTQQQPVDIDALLDDVTSAIPGGYEAWRQREGLVPPSASDLGDDELRAMLGLD